MAQHTQTLYKLFEPEVETLYYQFCSNINEVQERGSLLLIPGKESYIPGIQDKTIAALAHKLNGHDYVIRSNVSTVVNFANLLPLLNQHPIRYGGTHIMESSKPGGYDSKSHKYDHVDPLLFAQGTCLIFDRATSEKLLQNYHDLDRTIEDDMAFASLLDRTIGLKPEPVGRQFAFFHQNFDLDSVTAFRNHHFHSDRSEDCLNVARCVSSLKQRLLIARNPEKVLSVFYHTQLVTDKVRKICTDGPYQIPSDNGVLDKSFGDPCIGHFKFVMVLTTQSVLTLNTTWTFCFKEGQLYVQ